MTAIVKMYLLLCIFTGWILPQTVTKHAMPYLQWFIVSLVWDNLMSRTNILRMYIPQCGKTLFINSLVTNRTVV